MSTTEPRPEGYEDLNLYSRMLVDEAQGRGLSVEVLDARTGELALSAGGGSRRWSRCQS